MRNFSLKAIFLLAACLVFSGAVSDLSSDDRAKDSVERRQKIELEKFYYGDESTSKAPMTPMAIQLYNEAVKFYEKGEYDLARQAALDSLGIAARNPMAYELLGMIADLRQDFEQAEKYFKQSYLLNPSSRVRDKLLKLQAAHKIEKKLDTYDEEHFIIKYRKGEQGYEGYWLKNMLRDRYRQISQDFGYYLNHKIVVLFYGKDEFYDVTGQSRWVRGIYDGKIRLPAYRQGFRETALQATAAHEMTHAFVAILGGMQAPVWLHEGLAQYEENKVRPVNLAVLRAAIKARALVPIGRLLSENQQGKQSDPLQTVLFYQESFSLVDYMIRKYQMYRIREILGKFKEGKTAEEAIEEVLSISVKRLEKEWLASVLNA